MIQPLLTMSWGFSIVVAGMIMLFTGCGASSPRFVSEKTESSSAEKTRKGSIRFSSKAAEEERKEDDRKVDVGEVRQRFSSAGKSAAKKPAENKTPASPETFEDQRMMDAILAWMGTPYEYGGESRSGIDCSAFTREMFRTTAGVSLPRTTEQQVKEGRPVSRDQLKFGDLIFFNTTGQNPSHVGIYIGDEMFAHASVSSGVTLSSLYSSYFKKRYTEARRILP